MYFEPTDTTLVNIYSCKGCKKIYHRQLGQVQVSCTVMHGAGSCCHYGERDVTGEQVEQIRAILGFIVPQHNIDGSITVQVTTDGTGTTSTTTIVDEGFHLPQSDF